MLITLTIVFTKYHNQIDIQVNPQQRIEDFLTILEENNLLPKEYVKDSPGVKSERKKGYINTRLTFEQAAIYTGDCLLLS